MSFLEGARFSARVRFPLTVVFLARVIPLALLAGCTSSTPECPTYNVGAIEGRILGGGLPVEATVIPRSFDPNSIAVLGVSSDSTGAYAISVPSGPYYLHISTSQTAFQYTAAGAAWSQVSDRDSLHVGIDVVHVDVIVGRLDVEIRTSPPITDEDFVCEIYDARQGFHAGGEYAEPGAEGTLRFTFPAVPPGEYTLRIESSSSFLWLPSSLDPEGAGADRIEVSDNAPTVYEHQLESWSRISGRVVGCWADGSVPGLIGLTADSLVACDLRTADDGAFRTDVLLAQPLRLLEERRGIQRWIGGADFQHARVFDLRPGESLDDIVLLESGIECDFDTLVDWRTEFAATVVGETGRLDTSDGGLQPPLRIPNLEPGAYRLQVRPERGSGWLPQWYEGSDSMSTATPIVISQPGEIAHVTMHLVEGGKIRGRILDAYGNPVAGAEVRFFRLQDGLSHVGERGDISDTQGAFEIVGLGDGDYIVGARSEYSINWFPGVTDPDAAEAIPVRGHAVVEGIEWRIP